MTVQHIAIIMDGNGRWAARKKRPRTWGHKAGVKAVKATLTACVKADIKHLTLFAFSSENWQRPEAEVSRLMSLFLQSLEKEAPELNKQGVALNFIGDLSAFTDKLQKKMQQVSDLKPKELRLSLNIAVNYGGRWDLLEAAKNLAIHHREQAIDLVNFNENDLNQYICLADQPPVDILIRTGGEQRLSNFLLWQSAYAELFFLDILWPDFDELTLQEVLLQYHRRERRFGQTSEQINA